MRSLRIAAALSAAVLVSCVATARPSRAYYLSQPAAALVGRDSTTPVLVYMDERTVLWLNAVLAVQRHQFREAGVCLRIAKDARAGFRVDSFINGRPGDWPGADTIETNWRQTAFTCPRDMAPLHFHVIQAKDAAWLMEHGHTEYLPIDQVQCRVGGNDLHPYWSQFPFNAVQCGYGVDSILVYRVRR